MSKWEAPVARAAWDADRSRHVAAPTVEPTAFWSSAARRALWDVGEWALRLSAEGNHWAVAGLMIAAMFAFLGLAFLLLWPIGLVHNVHECPQGLVWLVSERVCVPASSLVPAHP